MSLRNTPFIFIDCQTTGATPDHGDIIELAFAISALTSIDSTHAKSLLVKADTFTGIPTRIRKLTGLCDDDIYAKGLSLEQIHETLLEALKSLPYPHYAVIHFARFERAFLEDLFVRVEEADKLPFRIICTHTLAKRLFPNLPARSLRALAGYFNRPIDALKRSGSHVEATMKIWSALVQELEHRGVSELAALERWLDEEPSPKKERHEYPIERIKRLSLSHRPGIYKMLSKTGDVLYVGKATSLKSRVNSYFRGRKGRDSRKLEMLTQTWDIQTIETETALEAALLESDEIKRLNPPYNVSLKKGDRVLNFFDRDFRFSSATQCATTPLGPFTSIEPFERAWTLIDFVFFQHSEVPAELFWQRYDSEVLKSGRDLFLKEYCRGSMPISVRDLIALGGRIYRAEGQVESEDDTGVEENTTALSPEVSAATPQDACLSMRNMCLSLFHTYRRSHFLTRLLFSKLNWQESGKRYTLRFQHGRTVGRNESRKVNRPKYPWSFLGIEDYDRMVVFGAELKRMGKLENLKY